jgi:hypothetical protein
VTINGLALLEAGARLVPLSGPTATHAAGQARVPRGNSKKSGRWIDTAAGLLDNAEGISVGGGGDHDEASLLADAESVVGPGKLSRKESNALTAYCGPSYSRMNYQLRHPSPSGKPGFPKEAAQSSTLADVAGRYKSNQSMTAFRGIDRVDRIFGEGDATGRTFTDHGFTSLAHDREVAEVFSGKRQGALIEVAVPKGTAMLPVNATALGKKNGLLSEYILPPGSRMRVVSDSGRTADGDRLIKVELVAGE